MGNKSYGVAWDMDYQLAKAKLHTTLGWDHISDYTRHDHDIWYTEDVCTYGDIRGRCTRGGLGHISQAIDNYTFKTRLDWQKSRSAISHINLILVRNISTLMLDAAT